LIQESRRLRPLVLASMGLSLLAATAGVLAMRRHEPPPILGAVPRFELLAHTGRALTLGDLRGAPWIADFIFTHCSGTCPSMTSRLARLQDSLPKHTRLVSFTVDPTSDTPEVLARYARDFHAGESWLFVTGTQERLYDLATNGFKLGAFEVPPGETRGGDGPFLHSQKYVLVDGRGRIRGYYGSAEDAAVRRLAADVAEVAAERE
jgi:protein SCO1/2